jgi:hypothetical protein
MPMLKMRDAMDRHSIDYTLITSLGLLMAAFCAIRSWENIL